MSEGMAGLLGGLIGLLMTLLAVGPPLVWYHWGSIKRGLKQLMSRIDRLKEKKRKAKRAGFLLEGPLMAQDQRSPIPASMIGDVQSMVNAGLKFDEVAKVLGSFYSSIGVWGVSSSFALDPNKSVWRHQFDVFEPPPKEVRAQRVAAALIPFFSVERPHHKLLYLGLMVADHEGGPLQECTSPGYHRQRVQMEEIITLLHTAGEDRLHSRQYVNREVADFGFPHGYIGGIGYALTPGGPFQGWAKLTNPMIGTNIIQMSISPGDFSIEAERLEQLAEPAVLQASSEDGILLCG